MPLTRLRVEISSAFNLFLGGGSLRLNNLSDESYCETLEERNRKLLRDRVLVTGVSGAVGRAVAELLLSSSIDVVGIDRRDPDDALDLSTSPDASFRWIKADISNPSELADIGRELRDREPLSGIVCAAGIEGPAGSLLSIDDDDFAHVMNVNVTAQFLCMKYLVPALRHDGRGSIVMVGSTSGALGNAGAGAYVTSKHAVVGLTRAAAVDLAPLGIRVNCVAPGPLETPLMAAFEQSHDGASRIREWYESNTPLRRYGTVEEVAQVISFLLSSQASFITGGVYLCDGGLTASGRIV